MDLGINPAIERSDTLSAEARPQFSERASAGVTEDEIEPPQAVGWEIRNADSLFKSPKSDGRVQIVKELDGGGVSDEVGCTGAVGAIAGHDRCVSMFQNAGCLLANVIKVFIKTQRYTCWRFPAIPVFGVIRNIAFIENDGVVLGCQCLQEASPKGGVSVTPGGRECEAEDDEVHDGSA
jgi:hypothetical protein